MDPVSHGFLNVEKEAKDRARVTNTKRFKVPLLALKMEEEGP